MSENGEATKSVNIVKKLDEFSIQDDAKEASTSFGSQTRDVELFVRATELEQLGKVSQGMLAVLYTPCLLTYLAIKFYEQAFRLNPDVDKAVSTHELNVSDAGQDQPDDKYAMTKPKFEISVPGLFEELSNSLVVGYEPLGLPMEVLHHVLGWVGCTHAISLEECAKTCKKMYIASRSASIWRKLYHYSRASKKHHRDPLDQMSPTYRHLYFTVPRLRTDGLYVCKISYFRPGITDGAFFQPIHLVTYYRYLRFFGAEYNYNAMLTVTTEEPKKVIGLLKSPPDPLLASIIPFGVDASDLLPFSKKRGGTALMLRNNQFRKMNVFIGKYVRDYDTCSKYTLTLYDPQSAHNSLFEMEITVSRKNNTIVCDRYTSFSASATTIGKANRYDFDTKDWSKFIFSRVRSYIF